MLDTQVDDFQEFAMDAVSLFFALLALLFYLITKSGVYGVESDPVCIQSVP